MSEKPLHVCVAEVLGWTDVRERAILPGAVPEWSGSTPGSTLWGGRQTVPRFDTDWAATGPLIQLFGLGLRQTPSGWWEAWQGHEPPPEAERWGGGAEILTAVCNEIMVLHAAGKL